MGDDNTAIWAFTTEQVAALTKLSVAQLRNWRRTGFFASSYGPESYFYSFRDLVGLRTIAGLRASVSLQELRKVGRWLEEYSDTPWSSLALYVGGNKVYLKDPATGAFLSRVPKGQTVLPLSLQAIANDAQTDAARMRKRRVGDIGRINSAQPTAALIAGTRVPTTSVWALHEAKLSDEKIAEEYPALDLKDIRAAIQYERARRKRSA